MKKKVVEKKSGLGRPALPEDQVRSGRISMRTYPEIAEKVRRNGTVWLERLVRRAKDGDDVLG